MEAEPPHIYVWLDKHEIKLGEDWEDLDNKESFNLDIIELGAVAAFYIR